MIYIGYDPTQEEAFKVCVKSIERFNTMNGYKLHSSSIPEYQRNFGEPQSTDFTFTRFLVPYMAGYEGVSIFCDCDFLFLSDPLELHKIALDNPDKAVHVVKHPPYSVHSEVKMDGRAQHNAYRKNWASLMVFNNEHPANAKLTPEYINTHPRGKDFHELHWLKDEEIGELPLEWNCLDQYYYLENPKAIHYTDGGPWLGYTNTRYAHHWMAIASS